MRPPAILAVDDDPAVLAAVCCDLRRGFGEHYRVLKAGSAGEALELLRRLRLRGDPVALVLSDQRMPEVTGTEFLIKAREIVPDAKRVLLTAYADTGTAIDAINAAALDYYLLKPWDPPEEQLFPVIEDLLTTWKSSAELTSSGVRLIGHRFSGATHELRDFLARNRVPARWLDIELDDEAGELLQAAGIPQDYLPVVLLDDGTVLEHPTVDELARWLRIERANPKAHYDVVIVGGGPAGLAAAVAGASEGLKTVLVEREAIGGQAGQSSRIENYLGFPAGLSGSDLARRGTDQAVRLGAELARDEAVSLGVEGSGRLVHLTGGGVLSTNAVVLACGASYRRLDAAGFHDYDGAGIYYGAGLSEARACADQHVVVIGGANSAGQAAVHLSEHAAAVTLLVRDTSIASKMSHYLVERIAATPNITVRTGSRAASAAGDGERLRTLEIEDHSGREALAADACFVMIGAAPRTDWLPPTVARDPLGYILTGRSAARAGWGLAREPHALETTVPGVFAAGDARASSVKRVANAAGEGSAAIALVHRYLGA